MADLVEVLESSPERSTPPCPQFSLCGGCSLQHRSYASQRSFKRTIVRECIERVLGETLEVRGTIPSPRRWDYRTKAVLQVHPKTGKLCMVGKEKRLVSLRDGCRVLSRSLNVAMEQVEDLLSDEREDLPAMMLIRVGRRTGQLQSAFAFRGRPSRRTWQWAKQLVPPMDSVVFTWGRQEAAFWGAVKEVAAGRNEIQENLLGMNFFVGAEDFFQSNLEQAERMHRWVGERILGSSEDKILDLCCGVGPFAQGLARRGFETVVGIDENRGAILRARRSAWENGLTRVHFINHALRGVGRVLLRRFGHFQRVVVDPPRGGLGKEGCESVLLLKPDQILYASCHPFTLAHDLYRFRLGGYTILEVQPMDMYPQTRHVETLVLLGRALDLPASRGYTFR